MRVADTSSIKLANEDIIPRISWKKVWELLILKQNQPHKKWLKSGVKNPILKECPPGVF